MKFLFLFIISFFSLLSHADSLLEPISYIKPFDKNIVTKNIIFYNEAIDNFNNNKLDLTLISLDKIKPFKKEMKLNKHFVQFLIDNNKYFNETYSLFKDVNGFTYQKMYLNVHLFKLNNDKSVLLSNIDMFNKDKTTSSKEKILITKTYILLKDFEKAFYIFSSIKNINPYLYFKLAILNKKYNKALDALIPFLLDLEDKKIKTNDDLKIIAECEWIKVFLSLKRQKPYEFKNALETFFNNNQKIINYTLKNHPIFLKQNLDFITPSSIKKELQSYSNKSNFFHIENILYFAPFLKESLNNRVASKHLLNNVDTKSFSSNNLRKIDLMNILFSKKNIYTKTELYEKQVNNLLPDLETIEYFNLGLLFSKIKEYDKANIFFKKSFFKNNNPLAGIYYLAISKHLYKDSIKKTSLFSILEQISKNETFNDKPYIDLFLKTFITNKYVSNYKYYDKIYDVDNETIISKYILFLNTKNKHYFDNFYKTKSEFLFKQKFPYFNFLSMLFFNLDKSKYQFISSIQSKLPLKKHLFSNYPPLFGETYIKTIVASGFLNKIDNNINTNALYNKTYLRNMALLHKYKKDFLTSSSFYESFKESNKFVTYNDKLSYIYVNFNYDPNIGNMLMDYFRTDKELNLIKVIYFLQNNDLKFSFKLFKNGISENKFIIDIKNIEQGL